MLFFQESSYLTNEVIDNWSEQAINAYKGIAGKRACDINKLRLTIEEVLIRFRDSYGKDVPCKIRGIRKISGVFFEISQVGAPHNPLISDVDVIESYDILVRMNVKPRYIYREAFNSNTVIISAPLAHRRNSMLVSILMSTVLSVVTWLISGLLPEAVRDGYIIVAINAIFSKMSTLFSALATPLVFCAVTIGIVGLGDITFLGKLGGRLIKRMMFTYGIAMLAMLTIGLPMGLASIRGAIGGENVFSDILTLILDIIPGNLFEPFSIDNDMQVIVIAMFVGVTMLGLGNKVSRIRSLLEELNILINSMMLVICKLLPIFVYFGFSNLLLSGNLYKLGTVSKIVIISLIGAVITISVTIIRTLIVTKISFKELFKAQLPSLLINLTTSSQVSALPESMKCCKEKWGIDERLVDFGLPFGIVFYMPNGAIMLGAIVWGLAFMSNGPIDPVTLGKLIFVSVVVAIAAPPIPGSAFAVLPILFSACGTDLALMPLAVIVGSTVGYLLPAMNGYCLQLELLMCAWKSDCISKDKEKT
ncbi:MAG: cation:dicarboxylase symporter family transporter [Clostridiales bacterium]|nr:cation:dicarboxylase symporter family transporter [Clostridiales bacterium]